MSDADSVVGRAPANLVKGQTAELLRRLVPAGGQYCVGYIVEKLSAANLLRPDAEGEGPSVRGAASKLLSVLDEPFARLADDRNAQIARQEVAERELHKALSSPPLPAVGETLEPLVQFVKWQSNYHKDVPDEEAWLLFDGRAWSHGEFRKAAAELLALLPAKPEEGK